MGKAKKGAGYTLAAQIGIDSGIKRLLDTPLIINGAQASTILRFDGAAASAAGWPEYAGAGILALQAGTAPTYNVSSPYLKDQGVGCKGNAGGYFSHSSLGQLTLEDLAFDLVVRTPDVVSTEAIVSKRAADATLLGWVLYLDSSVKFAITVAGAIFAECTAPAGTGRIIYVSGFVNRDEASGNGSQLIVNGVGGAGVNFAAVNSSASNAAPFEILSQRAGSIPFSGTLLYLGIHMRNDWHQAGAAGPSEWSIIHKQRFALLTGTKPLTSRSSPSSTYLAAGGNVGSAYQERIVSSAQQLFYMGAGSPRFSQRTDANNSVFTGAVIEPTATNICLQSQTFATTWVPTRVTVPTTAVLCPDGITRTTCTLHEDGTATTTHYLSQVVGGARTCFSVFAKAANRSWMRLCADDATVCFFNLSNGTIGTHGTLTQGMEYYGNGWYRCWITFITGGANISILLASADNTAVFSGLDQDSIYIFGAQAETGNYPSTYVPTTTVAVTRVLDTPHRYSGAGHFGPGKGSLKFRFLAPTFTPTGSKYLLTCHKAGASATDYITIYIDTSGYINVASAASGGVAGACQKATNYCNNVIHTVIVSWQKNNLRLWVDGVAATPDTTCDFATDLDTVDVGADNTPGSNQAGPVLVEYPFINPRADKWG